MSACGATAQKPQVTAVPWDTGRKVLNLQHRSARALSRVGARRNRVGAVRVVPSALGPQPGALGPLVGLAPVGRRLVCPTGGRRELRQGPARRRRGRADHESRRDDGLGARRPLCIHSGDGPADGAFRKGREVLSDSVRCGRRGRGGSSRCGSHGGGRRCPVPCFRRYERCRGVRVPRGGRRPGGRPRQHLQALRGRSDLNG